MLTNKESEFMSETKPINRKKAFNMLFFWNSGNASDSMVYRLYWLLFL